MKIRNMQDSSPDAPSPASDAELLFAAVREAGAVALTYFGQSPETRTKSDGTQVSEADLAADRLLAERLRGARPNYGWLSEETEDDGSRHSRERVWMADPIDGTHAFLKGVPEWTVCAALVEGGAPVAGAVFNPARGEFFHALRGGGAFLNGEPIRVSQTAQIEASHLAIADVMLKRSYWAGPWPGVSTCWVNSIAYRLALVACGRADGTMSLSKKCLWDLAAAHLLVQEAGGLITTHEGGQMRFDQRNIALPSVVAAGPLLHAALLERTHEVEITKDGPKRRTGN